VERIGNLISANKPKSSAKLVLPTSSDDRYTPSKNYKKLPLSLNIEENSLSPDYNYQWSIKNPDLISRCHPQNNKLSEEVNLRFVKTLTPNPLTTFKSRKGSRRRLADKNDNFLNKFLKDPSYKNEKGSVNILKFQILKNKSKNKESQVQFQRSKSRAAGNQLKYYKTNYQKLKTGRKFFKKVRMIQLKEDNKAKNFNLKGQRKQFFERQQPLEQNFIPNSNSLTKMKSEIVTRN